MPPRGARGEAGVAGVGEMTDEQLAETDAPDLDTITTDDLRAHIAEPPPPADRSKASAAPAAPPADATLDVHVVAEADADAVVGRQNRTLVCRVRNAVEDGQSNGVVTTLVATALNLPVYRVVLVRGQYRADKAFKLIGVDAVALERLLAALPSG